MSKIVEVLQSLILEINKYAIKNVIKMNKEGWNAEGPIKIYLISNLFKNDIMRAKYKLQDNSIHITEDLSKENREIHKKLVPCSLEEKNKCNKVFMKRETLVINGKAWTLSELENRGKNQMETDSTSHTGEKANYLYYCPRSWTKKSRNNECHNSNLRQEEQSDKRWNANTEEPQ